MKLKNLSKNLESEKLIKLFNYYTKQIIQLQLREGYLLGGQQIKTYIHSKGKNTVFYLLLFINNDSSNDSSNDSLKIL